MKTRIQSLPCPRAGRRLAVLLALALAPARLMAAAPDDHTFVYPNGPAEWSAAGDFDGNGLVDAVIVDRETGVYRIGYQFADGVHQWTAPRASGVAEVSGFSVGRVLDAVQHGLAFTAEEANRVNLVAAHDPAQAGVPMSVYVPSVGPNQVVALDIGGAGDTAFHDLFVASAWNGVVPFRTTTVRNPNGAGFTELQDAAATQRLERGNRVRIRTDLPELLAVVARGTNDTLRVISYLGGPPETVLQLNGLAPGSDYAAGTFAGSGLSHFLLFQPGGSNLWSYAVEEPVAGSFQLGAPAGFAFDQPIDAVVTLPGDGASRLLVLFNAGQQAAAYSYDGTNAPVLLEEFLAPEGERLLGASTLENHGFRLHAGTGDRTTRSLQYAFDAGTGSYTLERTDVLPPVSGLSGQANVFQFQLEPFVAPAPRLLNSGNAGDWSSMFSLAGGPPEVGVLSERFVSPSNGLDHPTPASLGAGHPQTQFGLVNQYTEFISLFSLAPGLGNEVVEVRAQPPGGLFARSVAVTFVVGSPAFQVFYRLNANGAWLPFNGNPVRLFQNTTLQYRARAIFGTAQTAIRTETYAFKEKPDELDSDGDGVPDYVEIANGLDPVRSGSDGDDDGFSDLEELLKETSPSGAASHPAGEPGYEQHAAVNLVVTPRPLDGTTGAETASHGGPHVRVFSLSGSQVGAAPVSDPPAVPLAASALVPDVFVEAGQNLLVAATEPHFDVVTPGLDRRLGRELVSVFAVSDVAPIKVNYAFSAANGALNAEAANWVAAAQTAYGKATNEVRFHAMPIARTTVAVLLEEKVRAVLAEASPAWSNLTFFPFRPADAGRRPFDDEARALLDHGDALRPAYDLKQMLESLESLVLAAPDPQVQSLNAVTHEIYRVSSVSNNAAPGRYRLPLDVLREFIRGGGIHSNYLAAGSFPAPLLADAAAGAQHVLASLASRPVTNLTLRVLPGSFAGPCTTLETVGVAPVPVNLFALGGGAFDFPDTFTLLPGSVVEVVGRPDAASSTCAGLNVEVLGIALAAVPASSDGDADGNLLIDPWEGMFLGGVRADAFGDADDDGYSNLQEMFEGTDPRDGLGIPAVPVAELSRPVLELERAPDGSFVLEWFWPERYAQRVNFTATVTPDLNQAPVPVPATPVHGSSGTFRLTFDGATTGNQFFLLRMQLAP